MTLKDLLSRNYILLVNLACFVGFCVQLANVVDTYVHPTQTTMEVNEKDLQDSDFPLLFKICINPSFNHTAIDEAGFDDAYGFFSGTSRFNSSLFGWAGHTAEGGVLGTVEQMINKVTLYHNPNQVIKAITIWTNENEFFKLSVDMVELRRLNYPYNCYTLDLSKSVKVQEMGVKQIFFYFRLLENTSVELLLRGASMICNRELKSHKFYSSGADIKLPDLGKHKFKQTISARRGDPPITKWKFFLTFAIRCWTPPPPLSPLLALLSIHSFIPFFLLQLNLT